MNRVSHTLERSEGAVVRAGPKRPLEALILDRLRLIQVLRRSLAELHEHRRTSGDPETASLIRYWGAVLDWLKDQEGADAILMNRTG